jgi:hypothetical protein
VADFNSEVCLVIFTLLYQLNRDEDGPQALLVLALAATTLDFKFSGESSRKVPLRSGQVLHWQVGSGILLRVGQNLQQDSDSPTRGPCHCHHESHKAARIAWATTSKTRTCTDGFKFESSYSRIDRCDTATVAFQMTNYAMTPETRKASRCPKTGRCARRCNFACLCLLNHRFHKLSTAFQVAMLYHHI